MKLYEFADEFAEIAALAEQDGELTASLELRLNCLEMDLGKKADNICRLIKLLDHQAASRRSEADRMRLLAHQDETRADSLRAYLIYHMQKLDKPSLNTECFKVRVCQSPASVQFDGRADLLPEPFVVLKKEPNKRHALEVWHRGESLPEGFTVKQGQHLRIT